MIRNDPLTRCWHRVHAKTTPCHKHWSFILPQVPNSTCVFNLTLSCSQSFFQVKQIFKTYYFHGHICCPLLQIFMGHVKNLTYIALRRAVNPEFVVRWSKCHNTYFSWDSCPQKVSENSIGSTVDFSPWEFWLILMFFWSYRAVSILNMWVYWIDAQF